MAKTVVKEIIIGLLLCLAIILILSVLLYGYIPSNKVVPEPVAYTVPEEAKEVLKESSADTSQVILTYEVNSSDLSTAQKTNDYNPGKVNPFSSYLPPEEETTTQEATTGGTAASSASNGQTTNQATNGANATTNNSQQNSGSDKSNGSTNQGTYFKDKGTK